MNHGLSPRELAWCGIFGASGILMPFLFHLVGLGHIFMPMYLPLVALAFYVRPIPAAITAAVVPILSGIVTSMPPLYPPIALVMAIELAMMAALIALARRRWPMARPLWILVPVLGLGRVVGFELMYALALVFKLTPTFVASLSIMSGWPGLVLMVVAIPPLLVFVPARRDPLDKADPDSHRGKPE